MTGNELRMSWRYCFGKIWDQGRRYFSFVYFHGAWQISCCAWNVKLKESWDEIIVEISCNWSNDEKQFLFIQIHAYRNYHYVLC